MATYAFDIYPADDPAGKISTTGASARLVRLTIDGQMVQGEYTHAGFGVGSGSLSIHTDHADANETNIAKRNYVQFIRTDTGPEQKIGGFFLEEGEFDALSRREQGGRILTFEGPGSLWILDRYKLGHAVYATGQPCRGDCPSVPMMWAWRQEPYAAMFLRAIEEGQDHPAAFFAAVTVDFTRTEDSNSNDWDELEDYQTPIRTNVLDLYEDFTRLGCVFQGSADLLISAYRDIDEFRTDRTSATFTAGKARFAAGVNINNDLPKRIAASQQRTHVLIEDRINDFQTIDEDLDGNPIDGVPYMAELKSSTTADDAAIVKMGKIHLTRRDQYKDQAVVRHIIGDGTGQYAPGPVGDYWVLDLVTLHTGTAQHDFNESPIEVASIRYFHDDAGNWFAESELGAQYINPGVESFQAAVASTIRNLPANPRLCEALTPGDESLFRFYCSDTAGAADPAIHGSWDVDATGAMHSISTTRPPSDPYGTSGSGPTNSNTGTAGGRNIANWNGMSQANIGTDLAAVLAAGGATIRGQFASRARSGIGISESSQDIISNFAIRVTTGATTTVRGTAYAPHTLASSAGSVKWLAATVGRNAAYPAAAASNVLAAVSGTVATDRLVLELGGRNFTTVTSGFSMWLASDSATDDLPEDDSSPKEAGNGWIEIRAITPTTGSGLHPDLVGDDTDASRCDHKHHVIANRAPTTADDITLGYPTTTQWTDTDSGITYLLVDEDTGEWIVIADPNAYHVHDLENVSSASDPTVTDDEDAGYSEGWTWNNTTSGDVFFLRDATAGAADWLLLAPESVVGGSVSFVSIVKWGTD